MKTSPQAASEAGASADMANLSFESALSELEEIVKRLEGGKVGLEESIAIYERGAALKAHCESKLKTAQARVDKIVIDAQGQISSAPADL